MEFCGSGELNIGDSSQVWQGADIEEDRKNNGGVDRCSEQIHHKEEYMNGQ